MSKITIKHNILKDLRQARMIRIEDMPKKLGITLEEYKIFELEDKIVDITFANKLSGIFKRNWSVFLLDSIQLNSAIKSDNRTIENQTPTFHEKTIEALEDATYIYEFIKNLDTYKGLQTPKYKDIENLDADELGARLRKLSKISVDDQKKFKNPAHAFRMWISFVESMGILILQYPLNFEDKIRAFSISNNERGVIVLNTSDTEKGRIFSLLHELCHVLRRSSGICDLHNSIDSDVEVFCNKFASAFLVPPNAMDDLIEKINNKSLKFDLDTAVKYLSGRLKVSQLVVYRKLLTYGKINTTQYSELHNKLLVGFRKSIVVKSEEGRGGANYYDIRKLRNGARYSNVVFEALYSGKISTFEASHALGVSVKNLSEYQNRTA